MNHKEQLLQTWQNMNVDQSILNAFMVIPREQFIPPQYLQQAYHDHPLPTLRNQSISQPSTIVLMLQALNLQKGDNVFELGAGVGYQAALISNIINPGFLVSSDIIPELVQLARMNLQAVDVSNALIIEADGSEGHEDKSPFNKVIITAACPTIPKKLIDQLKEGGVIVAPVGDLQSQTMVKGTKVNGKLELEFLGQFTFVPMRGKNGFQET